MKHRTISNVITILVMAFIASVHYAAGPEKLDRNLQERLVRGERGAVRVIIRTRSLPEESQLLTLQKQQGRFKKSFWAINAIAAEIDVSELEVLSNSPGIEGISEDAIVRPFNDITVKTVGADIAQAQYAVDGHGIGVAILDSGVSKHGDDLDGGKRGRNRIVAQWSTVGSMADAHISGGSADDYFGHGTHVVGIIAGNGNESKGILAGVAPRAEIINVKVLGDDGSGYVSDVIEGIQWVIQNKAAYNIRVINLSLGHPVIESYKTDPLTQACEAAVRAGIVVVVAAGNYGKDEFGNIAYGGITSPGNDPMVITVGATKSLDTPTRSDDTVADYSSRGPTAFDLLAKPDLLAPGNRVKSLADPSPNKNDLFDLYPQNRVDPAYYGQTSKGLGSIHYFTLSGTSMATPVVSGTVALMLEANPDLTPNLVKAILMTTAQDLRLPFVVQGSGYINTYGAVMLAKNISRTGVALDTSHLVNNGRGLMTQNEIQGESVLWGGNIIWGNTVLWGGIIEDNLSIWGDQVAWGSGNVLWSSGNVLWSSGNVLWSSGNVLWSSAVTWGGNIVLGGSYIGTSGIQVVDPVNSSTSLWGPNFGENGKVLTSGNVLWSSGNVLWSSSILIYGEN